MADTHGGRDPLLLNKIGGGILAALLLVMTTGFLSEAIFAPKKPKVAGYELPSAEEGAAQPAQAAKDEKPLAVRLASADVKKGENQFKQCTSCHAAEKGGANKQGPALWGIVERAKGATAGFNYSNALKERAAKGEKWGLDELDKFIANPKGYLAGTSMGYAGLNNGDRRADLLAYLNSLADSPKELPKP